MDIVNYIPGLPDLGSYASIIGLIISLYLIFGVRKLRKQFDNFILLKARVPELRKELEGVTSSVIKLMNEYPDSLRKIQSEFSKCDAILKNLGRKIKGEHKRSVNLLQKLIQDELDDKKIGFLHRILLSNQKSIPEKNENEKQECIYAIHRKLEALILEIRYLEEDQKWSLINE
ncbi:hypothetical protein L0337_35105 [candidate division KSB1 bacterium]|nr:hypothetical protein [candidate division KSB1 bacterium]